MKTFKFVLMRLLLFFSAVFLASTVWAQGEKSENMNIELTFQGASVVLDEELTLFESGPIEISTLKLYLGVGESVSDLQYHLIDLADPASLVIQVPKAPFLLVSLGVDSTTQVSGAYGGALDPMNDMYWSWQSGYINFKIEGEFGDYDRGEQEFSYHLGGYQYPSNSYNVRSIRTGHQGEIKLELALDEFFKTARLKELLHVMSPGKEARELTYILFDSMRLKE
jgi:hypothetical protein